VKAGTLRALLLEIALGNFSRFALLRNPSGLFIFHTHTERDAFCSFYSGIFFNMCGVGHVRVVSFSDSLLV
jgi:hypothetical protein